MNIKWPYGVDDGTGFGLEESIVLYPGDMAVFGGEGNVGKTTIALNLLVNNWDKFPDAYLFTKEFNENKFRDRMRKFSWANLAKPDGKRIFHLVKQEDNYQDVIVKDALNVIDWIALDDEPYRVRGIMDKIQNKLGNGLAVINLQKRTYKSYAEGGEYSKDYASAYFLVTYDSDNKCNILTVEKVKTPGKWNPNYKSWRFNIDGGAKLYGIEEVVEDKKHRTHNYKPIPKPEPIIEKENEVIPEVADEQPPF